MEGEQSIGNLIALGISVILFFVILFLSVLISQWRRLRAKKHFVKSLENKCDSQIRELRDEISVLKKELGAIASKLN